MKKPRVFLSHASDNKGAVKRIALALIEEGFSLFIDRPVEMNFNADFLEDNDISCITPGKTWNLEGIQRELAGADVVLLCLSNHFKKDREVWVQEASFAATAGKLVCCRIDDVPPSALPKQGIHDFGALQFIDLDVPDDDPLDQVSPSETASLLAQAGFSQIARELHDRAKGPGLNAAIDTDEHRPSVSELMRLLPLAGRTDAQGPYHALRAIVDDATKKPGVYPALICGPAREEIENFISGLDSFMIEMRFREEALTRLGHEFGTIDLTVVREGEEGTLRDTLFLNIGSILRQMLPAETLPEWDGDAFAFVKKALPLIGTDRGPILCVSSTLKIDHMNNEPAFFATVDAWARAWTELADVSDGVSVVAVLPIEMVGAEPGWQRKHPFPPIERLFGFLRGPCMNALFHKKFFGGRAEPSVEPARRVGVIEPVARQGASDWALRYASPWVGLDTLIEAQYGDQGFDGVGVNMSTLSDVVRQFDASAQRG